ncbi:MAG: Ig-like domain-containing protein [Gemmatimonadota bacterium]|nr:Ig-like domain-containing protein [Gemmatimonadota bacterium]
MPLPCSLLVRRPPLIDARRFALIIVAALFSGCGSGGDATAVAVPPAAVASVRVLPSIDTLVLGDSVKLTATALDNNGQRLDDRLILWSVGTPSVARAGSTGSQVTVTSVAPGTTLVGATSEHQQGIAKIVVVLGTVFEVQVLPSTAEIRIGQQIPLTVTVKDLRGHLIAGAPVSFVSYDATIARVNAAGVVTGVSAGDTKILVTSGAVSDSARIRVSP